MDNSKSFEGLDLAEHADSFNAIGWFIPPLVPMFLINDLNDAIKSKEGRLERPLIEQRLALIYSAPRLASMIKGHYSQVPYVQDFVETIREGVEAHFLGLDHAAVLTLMPMIEGVGKRIAKSHSLRGKSTEATFRALARKFRKHVVENKIGAVREFSPMFQSFERFMTHHLYSQYSDTAAVKPIDGMNRHGTLHGTLTDPEYGWPINFYKAISTIDFLCLMAQLPETIRIFVPDPTEDSVELAMFWLASSVLIRGARPA